MSIFDYHGKIVKHLGRVCNYAYDLKSQPTSIDISLTDRCNHNCPGCIGNKTGRKELSVQEWDRIGKDLKKNGALSIKISGGGEPTLYKDYAQVISNFKEAGLVVGFYTNASALKEEDVKKITRDCTWIRVSLDAESPKRHAKVHGVKMWNETLGGIRLLAKHKKRCTIGIGFLIGGDISWLYEAAKLSYELGVDYAQFRPFNNFPLTAKVLEAELERQSVRYWENQKRKFDVLYSSNRLGAKFDRGYGYCHAKHFIPSLATDGTVYPCCHLRGIEKYQVGDLKEQEFEEIMWDMNGRYFDFDSCVDHCRGDVINQLVETIRRPIPHAEFI